MIRTGMGGWSYPPWRETFYPSDVPKRRELEYASRQVTALEINSTFYRLPRPDVFLRWRDETPDDFAFAVKASRVATYRKNLPEAGESLQRLVNSAIALGAKLGPINWQLPPSTRFVADDIERFLKLLPHEAAGARVRHALEVRHASFRCTQLLDMARRHGVAIVFADTDKYPSFADVTADFVYGRLMRTVSAEPAGYAAAELRAWSERARAWARGDEPRDLPKLDFEAPPRQPRDVFLFFIGGAKERAPLAARRLAADLRADQP